MTEYWVSQGNKWCDFCKIYISNNPLSIRTHELGQRHKDNVDKRLANMRKESAAREKEQKEAARALEQIEAKAKRSYQKDLASFEEAKDTSCRTQESHEKTNVSAEGSAAAATGDEWKYEIATGYYYNKASGYYHDPSSGLYYSESLGQWVTQEAFSKSNMSGPETSQLASKSLSAAKDGSTSKPKGGAAPGLVVSSSLNPMRSLKGATSSIAVNKRKRDDGKTKVISKEEAAALKAREAAKKRVEEREKPLLGLYKSY